MNPRSVAEDSHGPCPSRSDSDLEDIRLVEAVRAGDERKFSELYRKHVCWVYARLTRLLGPIAERDDLLQESFLGLHRALPRFRGDARLTTFLHRIVVNVSYEHLTGACRRKWLPFSQSQLDELVEPSASPDMRAEQRQQVAQAFLLLDELKPKKRIAFALVAIEGMTLAEAAAVMGASEDAVKQRVLQARRELEQKSARKARKDALP